VIGALAAGGSYRAAIDLTISPTYIPDLVNASLDLLIDGEKSIWHVTNECAVTWADLAMEVADRAHLNRGNVYGCAHADLQWRAARPAYSALRSERAKLLPDLQNALDRYFLERELV
jgi:dTDP-4-dehydrorhamnose reductase